MDAFFAAVEQRDNPELRGKPIIVGGSPNKRGVVSTCSYEARKYGIHSGMASSIAARKCPKCIFVRSNFDAYRKASNIVREIFYEYTDLVEPLSIDEAFLDVTENKKNMKSATLLAKDILNEITKRTNLTASAGVSFNKFLAKVASDINKPNGIKVVTPDEAEDFIKKLPIRKFYGVGKVTEKKMLIFGIRTGADLIQKNEKDLIDLFGKAGSYYYKIVNSLDDRKINPKRYRKSIGKETTLNVDITDKEKMNEILTGLSEKIAISLEKHKTKGRTLTLKVKFFDFKSITRSITPLTPISTREEISHHAIGLLNSKTIAGKIKVRLLGISINNLTYLDNIILDNDGFIVEENNLNLYNNNNINHINSQQQLIYYNEEKNRLYLKTNEKEIMSKKKKKIKRDLKTFHIETYGCQMNKYDSELVTSILEEKGFIQTDSKNEADILLVNTCAVRENATDRVINKMSHFKNYKKNGNTQIIGILGCMPQHDSKAIKEKLDFIDISMGPDSYRNLPNLINDIKNGNDNYLEDLKLDEYENYDNLFPSRQGGVSAFVAITRGCNNFCTYCVVPHTRGRERSRPFSSIIEEIEKTVRGKDGFKEITLLGQNVNSYNSEGVNFPKLLDRVAQIDGLKRIRFATSHPKDLSDELIEVMVKNKNICDNLHLPFQSGSNRILKMMNRKYTIEEYLAKLEKIKKIIPKISLTSDVIIGFCSETDDDFEDTIKLIKTVGYDNLFTFIYSERDNTTAKNKFKNDVSDEIKAKRMDKLLAIQKEISLKRLEEDLGEVKEVLIESISKKRDTQLKGRTEQNRIVIFDKIDDVNIGEFVKIKITRVGGLTMFGEIV